MLVRVVVDEIAVRTGPSDAHPELVEGYADAGWVGEVPVTLSRDAVALMIERRTDASDSPWARVALVSGLTYETTVGWIPFKVSDSAALVPFDMDDCPASPDGGFGDRPLPVELVNPVCFGGREISLEGVVSSPGTACPHVDWLLCSAGSLNGLRLSVDPATGVQVPRTENVVAVTGHFADPRSAGCDDGLDDPDARALAVIRCEGSFVVDALFDPPTARFRQADVIPILEVVGTDTYADGAWTRHTLRVANWSEFPAALFVAAPDLEPCGALDPASRSWLRLYDERGRELERYCAPATPDYLQEIGFVRRTADPAPTLVQVEIFDRAGQLIYLSEPVDLDE